jgi:integration host factor subunit alpha
MNETKNPTLTRKELAKTINNKMGFSQHSASQLVDAIFSTLRETLLEDNPIKLVQFGTFTVRKKNARIGRNPKTGVTMEISKRSMVSFRPSKKVRERINE